MSKSQSYIEASQQCDAGNILQVFCLYAQCDVGSIRTIAKIEPSGYYKPSASEIISHPGNKQRYIASKTPITYTPRFNSPLRLIPVHKATEISSERFPHLAAKIRDFILSIRREDASAYAHSGQSAKILTTITSWTRNKSLLSPSTMTSVT